MQFLKKTLRYFAFALVGILVFLGIAYTAMWFLVSRNVDRHLTAIWQNIPYETAFHITGVQPRVTGFPAPPQVVFSGILELKSGLVIKSEEFRIVGFPLSGLTLYADFPKGLDILHPRSKQAVHIDNAAINLTLPMSPPLAGTYEAMKAWQKLDDPLIINGYEVRMGEVNFQGRGLVSIDEQLQPSVQIETRVQGMDELFARLSENGIVNKKDMEIARSFLDMVSSVDPVTGVKFFDSGINIQRRNVFIGPMRFYEFQEIVWPGTPLQVMTGRQSKPPPPETSEASEASGDSKTPDTPQSPSGQ